MNKHYLSSLLAVFLLALIAYLGSSIGLQWLFGIVLPYLAVVIFIVGVVRRVLGWSSSAVPFRITTTCGQQKSMRWMDTPVNIRKGMYCYASNPKSVETLGLPNARPGTRWRTTGSCPKTGRKFLRGVPERLEKFRSFKMFMDICVRCGACSDKCHFFIGTGDPKNMPVLRAELLRRCTATISPPIRQNPGQAGGCPTHDPGCA
jgi:ferredoxin